ncbi:MAG: hypothetical protein ACFNM7_05610, partial [Prevotella conceptionensis]
MFMVERLAVCNTLKPNVTVGASGGYLRLILFKVEVVFSVYIKHSSITQQLDNSQTHQLTNSSA